MKSRLYASSAILWIMLLATSITKANPPAEKGEWKVAQRDVVAKKLLDLDKKFSNTRTSDRTAILDRFGCLLLSISAHPPSETSEFVGGLLKKLRNTEFVSVMVHSRELSLRYATELLEYADGIGRGEEADEERARVFSKNNNYINTIRGFYTQYMPLDRLRASVKLCELGIRTLDSNKELSLMEHLLYAHMKNGLESRKIPELVLTTASYRNEGKMEDFLKNYFIFVQNAVLKGIGKGTYKMSYFIRRKETTKGRMLVNCRVSTPKSNHYYVIDPVSLAPKLKPKEAELKKLQAAWSEIDSERFSRIYDYVVYIGNLRVKGEAYHEFDDALGKSGWVGKSRHSFQIKKSVVESKSYKELSAWRRIFEGLMDEDVMYSSDKIPDKDFKESDRYIIGKKTAKRILILNDILARQIEPYRPQKILALQKKRAPTKYPIIESILSK